MTNDYKFRMEIEAVKNLMMELHELSATDDAELVAGTIEGQTDLLEVIGWALDEIDAIEVLVVGLGLKIVTFTERRDLLRKRAERMRAMIEQAMMTTELEKLRLDTATLSLRKVPPKLVVDDEALIPSRFFTPVPTPAPKLDKKGLAEAIKTNESDKPIPGAYLDNGSTTLAIRRK